MIIYDEVHLLPAPVFRMTADLQARRRADAAVPTAQHGVVPPLDQVRDALDYLGEQRGGLNEFDVVLGGATAPESAADVVGPLAEAGATWWDERQVQRGPDIDSLAAVLRQVGGPALAVARHHTSPVPPVAGDRPVDVEAAGPPST